MPHAARLPQAPTLPPSPGGPSQSVQALEPRCPETLVPPVPPQGGRPSLLRWGGGAGGYEWTRSFPALSEAPPASPSLSPSLGPGSWFARCPHMLSLHTHVAETTALDSYGDGTPQRSMAPRARGKGTRELRRPTPRLPPSLPWDERAWLARHSPTSPWGRGCRPRPPGRGGRVRRGWGRPGQACRGPGCTARCPSRPWLGSAAAAAGPRPQAGPLWRGQLAFWAAPA